jgi:hypothetical protein
MNSKNLVSGGFLILLGILFLGKEFGWFHINWNEITRLWPLLLIYLGIVAFFGKDNRSNSATVIVIILLCIIVPVALVRSCKNNVENAFNERDIHIDLDDDDDDKDNDDDDRATFKGTNQRLVEAMTPEVKEAKFNFSGGAAEFIINQTSKELIEADAELDFGSISLKKDGTGNNPTVDFALKGKKHNIHIDENNHNKIKLKLNPAVIWDMNFEFGAGKADFDLSEYKVKSLSIKTGVTKTDVKLGDKVDNLDVKVESGLTSIEFKIPTAVGCQIDIDGGLNAKDFEGFVQRNGRWETPNYDKATKKININFDGGLQELKVSRY